MGPIEGKLQSNYLYTGQQFDQSTELYSLRARFYSPSWGRFLSQDTWAVNYSNPIELNLYGYAAGNPVNASDPSGLFAESALINLNSSQNAKTVGTGVGTFAFVTTAKVAVIMMLVAVPSITLVGLLFGVDIFMEELTKDKPDVKIKSLEQIMMETQWEVVKRLGQNPKPDPEPEPQPTDYPPPPPILPTPQQTESSRCNPQAFIEWWFTLQPVPGSIKPGEDWYQYEQQVARAGGAYGNSPRRVPTGPIDADGIDPSTCSFIDAKHSSDEETTQWRLDGPPWVFSQTLSEFSRYRNAILISNDVPGGQPQGLIVRTPYDVSIPFFEEILENVGFTLGSNGFVDVFP